MLNLPKHAPRFTGAALFLLTCVSAGTAWGQSPPPVWRPTPRHDKPPTVSADSVDKMFIVLARPLLSQVSPGDGFGVALNFALKDDAGKPVHVYGRLDASGRVPFDQAKAWKYKQDFKPFYENLSFTIITPDGKQHTLTPAELPHYSVGGTPEVRHKINMEPQLLQSNGTWFITVKSDRYGLPLAQGKYRTDAKFKQKVDLSKPGKYKLVLSGVLVHGMPHPIKRHTLTEPKTSKFKTAPIEFTVDPRVATADQCYKAAWAAVQKFAPPPLRPGQPPRGIRRGPLPLDRLQIENPDGTRRIAFQVVDEAKTGWGYFEYQVHIGVDSKVKKIMRTLVGTCVAKGTRIATPNGDVPVERVAVGDILWSYDADSDVKRQARVRAIRSIPADQVVVLNKRLRVTELHPVLTTHGWLSAGQLNVGHRVRDIKGHWVELTSIEDQSRPVQVYDLSVDAPHTYFADGILVHNKKRLWNPNLDDRWYYHFVTERKYEAVK